MARECELNSIQDVKDWLHDPEHQIKTALYVIKWVGATPFISVAPTNRLKELDDDNALAAVVLLEHRRRRFRPSAEEGETSVGHDE